METKPFEQVMERFRALRIDEPFDMIVAIADGGILPAGILCRKLGLPVYLLRLNLRDECQHKLYDRPKLLRPIDFDFAGKRILLVEDRIKTGTTIRYAKELDLCTVFRIFAMELLADAATIKTFAVNGAADYCLYDEACFRFPWVL